MANKTTALVIVAHPDDETIWMGGTILKHPEWNWTILSLCRASDKDREPKFKKVCQQYYKAKPLIADLEDDKLEPIDINEIVNIIKPNLKVFNYDYIFTHGENGEYGHIRHKEVHQAVKKMLQNKELKCNKVYYFSYFKQNTESNMKIELSNKELAEKIKIITKLYGFSGNSFETKSCNKTETFDVEEFDEK